MDPIHLEVLDAARRLATAKTLWTFRLTDLVRSLPHLNPGTVRTHVASRCCVNAPSHHQTRYPYFRAVGRGVYRIEPRFRQRSRQRGAAEVGWQDRLLAKVESGVDPTLIRESLTLTPTERLERMREAAEALEAMKAP